MAEPLLANWRHALQCQHRNLDRAILLVAAPFLSWGNRNGAINSSSYVFLDVSQVNQFNGHAQGFLQVSFSRFAATPPIQRPAQGFLQHLFPDIQTTSATPTPRSGQPLPPTRAPLFPLARISRLPPPAASRRLRARSKAPPRRRRRRRRWPSRGWPRPRGAAWPKVSRGTKLGRKIYLAAPSHAVLFSLGGV